MKQLNKTFKKMKENNIIHRDLKLENILIKYNEDKTYIVKLTDYGCSKKVSSISQMYCSTIVGTNIYMAPEILKGEKYNYKCDLWSIGVIIYKLFFIKPPFSGLNESALIKNIEELGNKALKSTKNEELDDLIRQLLEKDPAKRLDWDKYFNHPFFKIKKINLIYETNEDNIENIFGEKFVENNKKNIELSINGIKSELISKCKLKKGKNNIIIILKNQLTNLEYMFYNCSKLKNIDELENLSTEDVNNYSHMFCWCISLSNLKSLENWNVSKGNDFSYMFCGCSLITDLKGLNKWDVSNGNNFANMFLKCKKLKDIKDLKSWDVSFGSNFSGIFRGCSLLQDTAGLENWNLLNCKNFSSMFKGCTTLKSIKELENWNVSNGNDFSEMFEDCASLKDVKELEKWDVSKGKNFLEMFQGCSSLSDIKKLKNWNIIEQELI